MLYCKSQVSTMNMLRMKRIPPSLLNTSDVVIGEGVFGICKQSLLQGTTVCVKQMKGLESSSLLYEAGILSSLSHPSLCWLIGVQIDYSPYQIVTPYYSIDGIKVELYDVLFKKTKRNSYETF